MAHSVVVPWRTRPVNLAAVSNKSRQAAGSGCEGERMGSKQANTCANWSTALHWPWLHVQAASVSTQAQAQEQMQLTVWVELLVGDVKARVQHTVHHLFAEFQSKLLDYGVISLHCLDAPWRAL
jgi:hypothetical protein